MIDFESLEDSKNRSVDRILTLRIIDGKKPASSTGLVDPRLFKDGGNRLHAVKELSTGLWYMRYDAGAVPRPLQQKFTKFGTLLDYAKKYFQTRNLEIVEVID